MSQARWKRRTYGEFLKDVDKDFILFILLVVKLGDGLLDSGWGDCARLEDFGHEGRLFDLFLFICRRLEYDRLVDDERADGFCGDWLGVAVVDYLVDDFVDENKVLADALLV
jgi:hypothetical protein